MADTNQRTVASITREGREPPSYAYNDPDLGPLEFLLAVMRAEHLPMATRIDAARALLPFTNPYPRPTNSVPRCTIVIGGLGPCDTARAQGPATDNSVPRCTIVIGGLGPCDTARAQGPATEATENRSENLLSANTTLTHDQSTQAPQNLTTMPNTPPLIDYSTPPTPAELQEIKAAVNKLRPDLAHLPVPEFHLCPCGHWITGEYDCCRRELSKLN